MVLNHAALELVEEAQEIRHFMASDVVASQGSASFRIVHTVFSLDTLLEAATFKVRW